jgi:hypothetical protein
MANTNVIGTAAERNTASVPSGISKMGRPTDPDVYFRFIMKIAESQPDYYVDTVLVSNAFDVAKSKHEGSFRKSGEPYIIHPLSVLETLVRLRCSSNVLAAGLLHDTMEDCGVTYEDLRTTFSDEVAGIVDAVTAIKLDERAEETGSMSAIERHEYLDRLTDDKLLNSPHWRSALLVRMADRVHNLSTIAACSEGKRRQKIEKTKDFLVPIAESMGMHYFQVLLNDYCLKYQNDTALPPSGLPEDLPGVRREESKEYRTLRLRRNEMLANSYEAFRAFDNTLGEAVQAQNFFSFSRFCPLSTLRGKREGEEGMQPPIRRALLPYEIKRQLKEDVDCDSFRRQDVVLNEVVLTCRAVDKRDMLSRFVVFYRDTVRLRDNYFLSFAGERDDALFVTLTDMWENNFRIVLLSSEKVGKYYTGDDDDSSLSLSAGAISDALLPKMRVYTYAKGFNGEPKIRAHMVPKGATALDLAFHIETKDNRLAFSVIDAQIVKYPGKDRESTACISEKDYHYPLWTKLSEDDMVHFNADYYFVNETSRRAKDNSSIDWFMHVNTERARSALVAHIKATYRKKDRRE